MQLNHWITFTGPAFVPTSTEETAQRETTGPAPADVGVEEYTESPEQGVGGQREPIYVIRNENGWF